MRPPNRKKIIYEDVDSEYDDSGMRREIVKKWRGVHAGTDSIAKRDDGDDKDGHNNSGETGKVEWKDAFHEEPMNDPTVWRRN